METVPGLREMAGLIGDGGLCEMVGLSGDVGLREGGGGSGSGGSGGVVAEPLISLSEL